MANERDWRGSYGGRNTVDTGHRPEDRGRSYGDWLGGAHMSRGRPAQQRGDMQGGYGQQGGRDYRARNPGGYESGHPWNWSGRDAEWGGFYDAEPRGGRRERGFLERAGDEMSSWFGDDDAERRRRMDARSDRYRGRGPRGYRRSDERIREDVNDRLTDDWLLDASEIEVAVTGSEVTLSGAVSSRSDKRRAEDIAENVPGVTHVQNNLRVQG